MIYAKFDDLRVLILIWVIVSLESASSHQLHAAQPPAWTGQGRYRVLVEVSPVELKTAGREQDDGPAQIEIDVEKILAEDLKGKRDGIAALDVNTIQVIRYDLTTGRPADDGNYACGLTAHDRPFRWYDASIPYEFPEVAYDINRYEGELRRKPVARGGYFYNAIGDWKAGRLAWQHTQTRNQPAHYAIYFDLLTGDNAPSQMPPRSWIGDGMPRCDQTSGSTTSADHVRIDLTDWNNDGLVDIISGEQYGHLFVWYNRGTAEKPLYPYPKFLFDSENLPIDVGAASTPKVVDWNNDGANDLLVGTEWNRVVLFINEGTNANHKLKYMEFVYADGETLALPFRPLVRGSEQIFKRDYYPVLETVDWDNDGDLDLLAGGYVTGRIFFYENTGFDSAGLPLLKLAGPLHADGKPLNVGHWCAAPSVADFDNDGDLDLISGNMPVGISGGDAEGTERFLRYYENIGTRAVPQLVEREFPADGVFPTARLASPRAADWDNDGDLDLVVSARSNFYLYENKGDAKQPRFAAHSQPLQNPWGASPIPAGQFLDWNGDGLLDIFVRSHIAIRLNSGRGNPWSWEEEVAILPPGQQIAHPSGIGDDWFWPFVDDFDQDGQHDILFGDWFGHIWFHRNLSTNDESRFDLKGTRLKLTSGELLKVGPVGKDLTTDFSALQGARTTFTVADFDGDGQRDLVVGDTYGIVRYFRAVRENENVTFADPVLLSDLGIRLLVDATDWDSDGNIDVIAGAANGNVRVFLNTGKAGASQFAEGFDPKLPKIVQPRVLMADLNVDGDEDLFLPSTQGSCFVERSYLDHGYAQGKVLAVEQRPGK